MLRLVLFVLKRTGEKMKRKRKRDEAVGPFEAWVGLWAGNLKRKEMKGKYFCDMVVVF